MTDPSSNADITSDADTDAAPEPEVKPSDPNGPITIKLEHGAIPANGKTLGAVSLRVQLNGGALPQ